MASKKKPNKKIKKLKIFGSQVNLNSFLLIGLIAIALFGAQAGWYKGVNQSFLDFVTDDMLNEYLNQQNLGTECTLTLDDNSICKGDYVNGRIKDGIDTECYVFAYDRTSWSLVYKGTTNSIGTLHKSGKVNEIGSYTLIAVCDKDNSKSLTQGDCLINYEQLEVSVCN